MLATVPQITNDRIGASRLRPLVYRSLIATVAAGALLGSAYAPAFAAPGATDTATTTVNVIVDSAITISGLPATLTLTGIPGAIDTVTAPFNVETNSAAGYTVGVLSQDAVLAPTTAGNADTIPIGTLQVTDEAGALQPVSDTAPVIVARSAARSVANTGDSLSTDFQITIPNVNEDTYTADLDFIATTL